MTREQIQGEIERLTRELHGLCAPTGQGPWLSIIGYRHTMLAVWEASYAQSSLDKTGEFLTMSPGWQEAAERELREAAQAVERLRNHLSREIRAWR